MTYYLYKITNLVNNKIYYGKTDNIRKRWNAHKTAARRQDINDYSYLHRAMNKYGVKNFSIEKIEDFDTEVAALRAEMTYIKLYDTTNRKIGYNLTQGGEGSSGFKHSDESKRKMSKAKKGKYIEENNPFYGKQHTEEFKSQQSDIMKVVHQKNKQIYDDLNVKQCSLTTEQCIDIQTQYLQNIISFEKLSENYSVPITTIWKIIRGFYAAIKDHSIITEEMFQHIKKSKQKSQGMKNRKCSPQDEIDLIEDYKSGMLFAQITDKYKISSPTINKILKKHNVIIFRGKRGTR
jgi:group I intron endonuclease